MDWPPLPLGQGPVPAVTLARPVLTQSGKRCRRGRTRRCPPAHLSRLEGRGRSGVRQRRQRPPASPRGPARRALLTHRGLHPPPPLRYPKFFQNNKLLSKFTAIKGPRAQSSFWLAEGSINPPFFFPEKLLAVKVINTHFPHTFYTQWKLN